eukprot:COSAG02_NODE_1127_length_14428_cov_68.304627_17_plen_80_part_00
MFDVGMTVGDWLHSYASAIIRNLPKVYANALLRSLMKVYSSIVVLMQSSNHLLPTHHRRVHSFAFRHHCCNHLLAELQR